MNNKSTIKLLLLTVMACLLPGADTRAQDTIREKFKNRLKGTVVKLHKTESAGEKKHETLTLNGRTVAVWQPEVGRLQAPLILFSHGINGCETQSSFLTQALADAGFIVAAPRHKDAICDKERGLKRPQESFAHAENWTPETHTDRKDDILAVLEALKNDPKFNERIDFNNIGLLGHSLGGYTVLGLAGGWKEWKMPNVKAVVALSPYCQPFAKQKTLEGISAPVQYQGGTRDMGITPFIIRENGCYDQTPSPAMFVEFQSVGHFSWTDLQKKSHDSMIFYTVGFFEHYLLGKEGSGIKNPREDVSELRTK